MSLEAWRSEVKAAADLVSGDLPLAHRWLFLAAPVPSREGKGSKASFRRALIHHEDLGPNTTRGTSVLPSPWAEGFEMNLRGPSIQAIAAWLSSARFQSEQ